MSSFRQIRRQPRFTIPWRGIIKLICFVLFVLLLWAGLNKIKDPNNFPITKVKIFGAFHENRQDLQEILKPLVSTNFFLIDVSLIKDRLTQLPWVAQASVRRHWPNEIDVVLQEQQPVARWNTTSLLSANAEVFSPPEITFPNDLPMLFGPEGQQVAILQYYYAINNILTPLHFKISRLELTPSMLWLITLDNGVQIIAKYEDVLAQLKQFASIYNKVFASQVSNLEYVDLRMPNGMAVKWKSVSYKEKSR